MRILIILGFFFFVTFLSLFNFNSTTSPANKNKGAIAFTFDDSCIEEWFHYKDLFTKYDIKATFFIDRPYLLDSTQINKLKILQKDGHEIACHGYNHLNALNFVNSINTYITQEVEPAIDILTEQGFEITSFAFPFGKSTPEIEAAVSKYFTSIRKATWNYNHSTLNTYNEIFASKDSYNIIDAMGIDMNFQITLKNIKVGIQRAKEKNEVLILYSHQISTTGDKYYITPTYLENIFKLCKEKEIKTIRMRDLDIFFKENKNQVKN